MQTTIMIKTFNFNNDEYMEMLSTYYHHNTEEMYDIRCRPIEELMLRRGIECVITKERRNNMTSSEKTAPYILAFETEDDYLRFLLHFTNVEFDT